MPETLRSPQKSSKDTMGDRMKEYEAASDARLTPRLPVILRLDGNSFSKLTKQAGFQKPFDKRFEQAMEAAATAVLEYCSGAQLAYLQSDEITILLRNDQNYQTTPFLANRIQKLTSLTASAASVAFNESLRSEGIASRAIFDCRAFVVPPSEVVNVFLWRQLDCFRNCISSYAYWEIGRKIGRKTAQKMLFGKSATQQQEVIFSELGVNPNELPCEWRRGRCIVREVREIPIREIVPADKFEKLVQEGKIDPEGTATRAHWVVDRDIPRFNLERSYIERFMGSLDSSPDES